MIMRMTVIRGDLRLKAALEPRQATDMLLIRDQRAENILKKPHSITQTRYLRHGILLPFSKENVISSTIKLNA
jgi:hypothetical protein